MNIYKTRWVVACVALLTFKTSATLHYVSLTSTNPVPPYLSWATAATNIQDAVFHASFADTVLVTNGIYATGGFSNSGSNRVFLFSNIKLQSVNGPAATTIQGYWVPGTTNGSSAVRCVYVSSGSTLSGFTLTQGATTSGGGQGGGVWCSSQSSLVTNCVIAGNAGAVGAGAYSGTLVNCKLTNNIAFGLGWGGGANGSILINCLLTGNRTDYRGAAAANCALSSCTVATNIGQTTSVESCKLTNCISYYNTPDNGSIGQGNNYNSCCTIPLPSSGANTITNPPAFLNLAGGDFHLMPTSPCINAGSNSFISLATDLDNNPRVVAGVVDLGAYEFQSPLRYVNISNAAPVSPYTNWPSAATNIQDAIDVSVANDFIVVSNGTYNAGGRVVFGTMTNRVAADKAVTIQSANGPAFTLIAGSRNANDPPTGIRCVYLTNGASLIGFTITNGATRSSGNVGAEQSGGGVWCNDSSVIVSNCVFTGNAAALYGGGAFQGTFFNCTFTNNTSSYGGGAASNALFGCTLVRNTSLYQNFNYGGAAAYCVLSNCSVVRNQAVAGGGFGGGTAFSTVTSCVVSNNSAANGGGLYFGVANSSLISSNRASNFGGGAYSNTLVNCVLKNNLAGTGGGAYVSYLTSCTVVSNTAGNGVTSGLGGGLYGGSASNSINYYNLAESGRNFLSASIGYCDTFPLAAGFGNITNEPVFVDLIGGNFHLQTNSPCINSGNNACVTNSTDFEGNPRIAGGTVDMGAYEYQSPGSIISYAYLQQYGLPTDGSADFLDSDGDGMNNYQEWIAGTNPTNALSVLKMASATLTNNPVGLVVAWQSVSGITYFLQGSSNLAAQPAFSTIQSNIVGQAGTTSYTDTTATNNGPYFYRVGVQ